MILSLSYYISVNNHVTGKWISVN